MENKMGEGFEDKEEIEGKPRKFNFWVISTIVLAILLVLTFMFGTKITGNVINSQEASSTVLSVVNKYLIQEGAATLTGQVTEESGLYKVGLNYNNNEISVYITKDGKSLILPNGIIDIAQLEATPTTTNEPTEENIPKTDKPSVELFVMSFCPYGVRAENNVMPLIELFKDKIDFKIKFIVNVNGDKIENVNSLHGINEAKEDARQAVIMKYYPDKFYDYLKEINNNCYSNWGDAAKLDECWKNAAKNLGMDVNKIESAAYGKEGIDLLKQNEADTNKYGVSGSPTLIINGVKSSAIYSGTAATQQAICSAFKTVPSECGTAVNSTASANQPSGSCG